MNHASVDRVEGYGYCVRPKIYTKAGLQATKKPSTL